MMIVRRGYTSEEGVTQFREAWGVKEEGGKNWMSVKGGGGGTTLNRNRQLPLNCEKVNCQRSLMNVQLFTIDSHFLHN